MTDAELVSRYGQLIGLPPDGAPTVAEWQVLTMMDKAKADNVLKVLKARGVGITGQDWTWK